MVLQQYCSRFSLINAVKCRLLNEAIMQKEHLSNDFSPLKCSFCVQCFRFPCSSTMRSLPVRRWALGMYSSTSATQQSNASQILSKCSMLSRSANSLYSWQIVDGRIPVCRDKWACVQRFSPRSLDRWILIISHRPCLHCRTASRLRACFC